MDSAVIGVEEEVLLHDVAEREEVIADDEGLSDTIVVLGLENRLKLSEKEMTKGRKSCTLPESPEST